MAHTDLTPDAAAAAIDASPDLVVLDVRTEPEHAMHRIRGSVLIPVQELADRVGELDASKSYVVVCEHGMRSLAACELLTHAGFADLSNLVGGMARWVGEGLPHDRGPA